MCFDIPSKIISIKGKKAKVECGGHKHEVNLGLIDSPRIGDYVTVQDNYATSKINQKEAKYILGLINNE